MFFLPYNFVTKHPFQTHTILRLKGGLDICISSIALHLHDDFTPEWDSIIDPDSSPIPETPPLPWPQCQWTVFPAFDFELTVCDSLWPVGRSDSMLVLSFNHRTL